MGNARHNRRSRAYTGTDWIQPTDGSHNPATATPEATVIPAAPPVSIGALTSSPDAGSVYRDKRGRQYRREPSGALRRIRESE